MEPSPSSWVKRPMGTTSRGGYCRRAGRVIHPKDSSLPYTASGIDERLPQPRGFYCRSGEEGHLLAKMVLKEDTDQLASQLLFEASNGFSVVFSGIMRKTDAKRLEERGFIFRRLKLSTSY